MSMSTSPGRPDPGAGSSAGASQGHHDPSPGGSWVSWLWTTDHKRIGILYGSAAFLFFLLGGLLAMVLRAELAEPGLQFVDFEGYSQTFTMHGTIMLLLFGTPMVAAFANYLIPLQVGTADMVFPRLNALSFWLFLSGGLIVLAGYGARGGPADIGWTGYPPNSTVPYSTTIGTDLWIVGLALTGVASILGAINFLATIFTRRAPGMSMFRIPMFCWTMLVTSLLILFTFPVLTGGLAMLLLERRFGAGFFDPAEGGDAILWQNLFWFFGHPEVYILALPFFGILSEVIPTFSRKPLFGYRSMAIATILIGVLSVSVWAHHMFTTGFVNLPFFSIASFLIAVPTGIKIFNWLATMIGGRLTFPTPMLFSTGFLYLFVIGGITGVMVASPPIDFQFQDTYFVVAHLHNVLVGGSVMAIFSGIYFWFPKVFGRRLSERLGKAHFWLWVVGFVVTFLPQYELGASGMPRRYADYPDIAGWPLLNLISTIGAVVMAAGVLVFLVALVRAFRRPMDQPADPWGGSSLEWWTSSPPPEHNFESLPRIRSFRPVFDARHGGEEAAGGDATAAVTPPPPGSIQLPEPARRGSLASTEPRVFLGLAGLGLVLTVIYWFVSYETAGTLLMGAFTLVNALLGIRLASGHAPAPLPGDPDRPDRERPFLDERGRLPAPTIAPFALGIGVSIAATALIFGPAPLVVGAIPAVWGATRWISRAGSELVEGEGPDEDGA